MLDLRNPHIFLFFCISYQDISLKQGLIHKPRICVFICTYLFRVQGGSTSPRAAAVGGRRLALHRRQRRREPEAELEGIRGRLGREGGTAGDAVAVVHGAVEGAQAPSEAPRGDQFPPHEVGQNKEAFQL